MQQFIVSEIRKYFTELTEDDIWSRGMGSAGEDIILSGKALNKLGHFDIECKHLGVGYAKTYAALEQAKARKTKNDSLRMPIAFLRNNRKPAIMVMYADDFLKHIRNRVEYIPE